MSKREKIKLAEDVAPNLVPMVDIMFLLLLFFMLSADMSNRELEDVVLPKALSVKDDTKTDPKKEKDESKRLTVNVYHKPRVVCVEYDRKVEEAKQMDRAICRNKEHWAVGIGGVDFTLPAGKEKLQTRLDEEAKNDRKDAATKVSERKVMIRVDALAPYGMAQQVMNLCAMVGIYKIEVGAAQPEEDRKPKGGH